VGGRMKVTLESTSRLVEVKQAIPEELTRSLNAASLVMNSQSFERLRRAVGSLHVPARVWEGQTESGIHVITLITRIAHHKRDEAFAEQFAKELQEQRDPSAESMQCFPARLII
jgi:hypothetical protein